MNEPVDPREPEAAGGEVEPPRFVYAVADHGCTMFIPRPSDLRRAAAIMEHARAWYQSDGEATS